MRKAVIQLANFNLVFLTKEYSADRTEPDIIEEPMLRYFDVVFKAFRTGRWTENETRLLFSDVQVIMQDSEYVLTGRIWKDDVHRDLFYDGENDPPFSIFAIFLRNHRMAFVKDQQNSPSLSDFESLVKYSIRKCMKASSGKYHWNAAPKPYLAVEGIPSAERIKAALTNVEKITQIVLRFYPLNGDVDFGGAFSTLRSEAKKYLGNLTGSFVVNSPTNMEGSADIISATKGTVAASIYMRYKDKTEGKITNDDVSEEIPLNISDHIDEETFFTVTAEADTLHESTEAHDRIYEEYQGKIKKCIHDKR